jgi:tetratricopeptide (TPR) repeat protein
MRPRILSWSALGLLTAGLLGVHISQAQQQRAPAALVLEVGGKVEFLPDKSANWYPCPTNQPLYAGDQLRTGPRSRAAVRLSDLTVFRMGAQGYLRLRPEQKKRSALDLLRGVFYFFHRDNPGEFDLQTPIVSAVVRGTEFNVEVVDDGTTTLTVLDGEVEMANNLGELQLRSGEQGRAAPGKKPEKTAVVEAHSVIQWSLYYPGVLDVNELELSAVEKEALRDSLSAYRSGDLLDALAKYPADRVPASPSEQIYLKALELAVGRTTNAAGQRPGDTRGKAAALDDALNRVIGIVQAPKGTNVPGGPPAETKRRPELATEWMAESIYEQARHNLAASLDGARRATEKSPDFGFAWERVAELEFGFGRIGAAKRALNRSLELSPRNAQALALMGFLLAAENRTKEAITWFDRAIAIDGGLGNAWLGRGLTRIRKGDAEAGRQDIQVAATVEPQRAAFRSYLGKAFSHTGDNRRATNELALAMELDPNDPTAWLYAALIKQQENRINEAVKDFEHAQELAGNRGVYRSSVLVDQDTAVSGVNVATIYQDAGMMDVSLREAGRAVSLDYSLHSSHLFLANSYNAQRDVRQVNLRYETPAVSEYLVANLLAPVGAGVLSPHVTQQEYSKLFERDRVGVSSTTEYLSRGDWYQALSQYGTFGGASYAVDGEYRFQNGDRPNNELEQIIGSVKFKQEFTPKDSVFVQGVLSRTESGDLRQLYNQNQADRSLEIKETQRPLALVGYHHEWSPASHTLFLGGYLQDTLKVRNPNQPILIVGRDVDGGEVLAVPEGFVNPTATNLPVVNMNYRSDFEALTGELQQIWKAEGRPLAGSGFLPFNHTLVVGARYQSGTFDTASPYGNSSATRLGSTTFLTDPGIQWRASAMSPEEKERFQRVSAYAYDNWQIFDSLLLSAGITYDYLEFPENFRNAPVTEGQVNHYQFSPKAGLVWTPRRDLTVRAAYTKSLAGVSFDQSFQLEPSQIAGFNQSYRSLIPESLEGAIAGAEFETWGVSVDQKFGSGTYLGAQAEWLKSDARRQIGITEFSLTNTTIVPGTTPQELRYEERTLLFTFNQLVGKYLALGLRYRLSDAELETHLTEIAPVITPEAHSDEHAILHQLYATALVHHPSGLFGQVESIWSQQSNQGYRRDIPGDDFWQFNVFLGYRFPRRQAELRVGLLNITDQDYQLNPLNLTPELPRDRTLFVSLKFHF